MLIKYPVLQFKFTVMLFVTKWLCQLFPRVVKFQRWNAEAWFGKTMTEPTIFCANDDPDLAAYDNDPGFTAQGPVSKEDR